MTEEAKENVRLAVAVTILVMIAIWMIASDWVEAIKIKNGYLTHNNRTYTVKLYDTLEKPQKENPE